MIRIIADTCHAEKNAFKRLRPGNGKESRSKSKASWEKPRRKGYDAVYKDQKSLNYKTESCECTKHATDRCQSASCTGTIIAYDRPSGAFKTPILLNMEFPDRFTIMGLYYFHQGCSPLVVNAKFCPCGPARSAQIHYIIAIRQTCSRNINAVRSHAQDIIEQRSHEHSPSVEQPQGAIPCRR